MALPVVPQIAMSNSLNAVTGSKKKKGGGDKKAEEKEATKAWN